MNATEFKQCRETLGLTQSELARLLRMAENGARSIRHYEAGTRSVPGPTSLVLDMLCNGFDPIASLQSSPSDDLDLIKERLNDLHNRWIRSIV